MRNNTIRLALAAAAAGITGAVLVAGLGMTAVQADPPSSIGGLTYNGVGSDTTQAIMDAFAGSSNGKSYAAVMSTDGSGATIQSFDAVPPTGADVSCIETTTNGIQFTRPNGSGAGQKALAMSFGQGAAGVTTKWFGASAVLGNNTCLNGVWDGLASSAATGAHNIGNQVQFARSSSGVSGTLNQVTAVPYAIDGLDAGYVFKQIVANAGTPTNLTRQQMANLFNNGPIVVGSGSTATLIAACDVNINSGTRKIFGQRVVIPSFSTPVALTTSTQLAPNGICNSVFEENALNTVSTRADAIATANSGGYVITTGNLQAPVGTYNNIQLVVPFSAAAFIAQKNGVAPSALPASGTYDMTTISDTTTGGTCAQATPLLGTCNIGSPYSIVSGVYTPTTIFYSDTTFSRKVYNVLPSAVMTATAGASTDSVLRSIFFGPSSPICQGTSTITAFGFLNMTAGTGTEANTCGTIFETGNWTPATAVGNFS